MFNDFCSDPSGWMQVLQLKDSIITSVVTADFDCMQFPSRAKAFSFPFSCSCSAVGAHEVANLLQSFRVHSRYIFFSLLKTFIET